MENKLQTETLIGKLEIGCYVKYNESYYIILENTDDGKMKIFNPLEKGKKRKLLVEPIQIVPTNSKARISKWAGVNYLLTKKNIIISLAEEKVMRWKDDAMQRLEIVKAAYIS